MLVSLIPFSFTSISSLMKTWFKLRYFSRSWNGGDKTYKQLLILIKLNQYPFSFCISHCTMLLIVLAINIDYFIERGPNCGVRSFLQSRVLKHRKTNKQGFANVIFALYSAIQKQQNSRIQNTKARALKWLSKTKKNEKQSPAIA